MHSHDRIELATFIRLCVPHGKDNHGHISILRQQIAVIAIYSLEYLSSLCNMATSNDRILVLTQTEQTIGTSNNTAPRGSYSRKSSALGVVGSSLDGAVRWLGGCSGSRVFGTAT